MARRYNYEQEPFNSWQAHSILDDRRDNVRHRSPLLWEQSDVGVSSERYHFPRVDGRRAQEHIYGHRDDLYHSFTEPLQDRPHSYSSSQPQSYSSNNDMYIPLHYDDSEFSVKDHEDMRYMPELDSSRRRTNDHHHWDEHIDERIPVRGQFFTSEHEKSSVFQRLGQNHYRSSSGPWVPLPVMDRLGPEATSLDRLGPPESTSFDRLGPPEFTSFDRLDPESTSFDRLDPESTSFDRLDAESTSFDRLGPESTSVDEVSESFRPSFGNNWSPPPVLWIDHDRRPPLLPLPPFSPPPFSYDTKHFFSKPRVDDHSKKLFRSHYNPRISDREEYSQRESHNTRHLRSSPRESQESRPNTRFDPQRVSRRSNDLYHSSSSDRSKSSPHNVRNESNRFNRSENVSDSKSSEKPYRQSLFDIKPLIDTPHPSISENMSSKDTGNQNLLNKTAPDKLLSNDSLKPITVQDDTDIMSSSDMDICDESDTNTIIVTTSEAPAPDIVPNNNVHVSCTYSQIELNLSSEPISEYDTAGFIPSSQEKSNISCDDENTTCPTNSNDVTVSCDVSCDISQSQRPDSPESGEILSDDDDEEVGTSHPQGVSPKTVEGKSDSSVKLSSRDLVTPHKDYSSFQYRHHPGFKYNRDYHPRRYSPRLRERSYRKESSSRRRTPPRRGEGRERAQRRNRTRYNPTKGRKKTEEEEVDEEELLALRRAALLTMISKPDTITTTTQQENKPVINTTYQQEDDPNNMENNPAISSDQQDYDLALSSDISSQKEDDPTITSDISSQREDDPTITSDISSQREDDPTITSDISSQREDDPTITSDISSHRDDPTIISDISSQREDDPTITSSQREDDPTITSDISSHRDDPTITSDISSQREDDPTITSDISSQREDDPTITSDISSQREDDPTITSDISSQREDDPTITSDISSQREDDPTITSDVSSQRDDPGDNFPHSSQQFVRNVNTVPMETSTSLVKMDAKANVQDVTSTINEGDTNSSVKV